MKGTSQFWLNSTYQQRSTLSTMQYYSDAYGFDGTVLHWFESNFCSQRQWVHHDSKTSALP